MSVDLPTNWLPVSFNDVFAQVSTSGKKVKTADTLTEGEFPVVDQGRTFISGYLDNADLVVADDNPLIIFGDHTREIKWIDFPFIPGADGVQILKPHPEMDARFLYFFLRNLPIESKGYARHFKILKDAEYLAPPLAEQTRIAQKLDELLAQVATLKARIDGIPALLKRFRQSVLAAAVSGRLTEEWRHHLGIPNPTDGKLSDCIETMIGGASPKTTDYSAAGMLALNKGDIKEYGRVEIKQNPKYVPFEFVEINSKKVIPDRTVLVTLRDLSQKADFLGLIGRYRGEQPALITQGMYGLKVNPRVAIEDYLIAFSNSPQYRAQVKREKVGATQVHLRNGQFLDFAVPIFVIEEQTEIVRRVEQLFAFTDQLEAKVASAKRRIDHLTQSILAKAFRGELVPQDPNDEPASVLLQRIKAQRAAAPKAKRGRKEIRKHITGSQLKLGAHS